jgi:hypothetical protein
MLRAMQSDCLLAESTQLRFGLRLWFFLLSWFSLLGQFSQRQAFWREGEMGRLGRTILADGLNTSLRFFPFSLLLSLSGSSKGFRWKRLCK